MQKLSYKKINKGKLSDNEYKKNRQIVIDNMLNNRPWHLFCQKCKRSVIDGHFHVHHIIYRSEAPYHENLHNPLNLIICCNSCHDVFHGKKREEREYLIIERGLRELFPDLHI